MWAGSRGPLLSVLHSPLPSVLPAALSSLRPVLALGREGSFIPNSFPAPAKGGSSAGGAIERVLSKPLPDSSMSRAPFSPPLWLQTVPLGAKQDFISLVGPSWRTTLGVRGAGSL